MSKIALLSACSLLLALPVGAQDPVAVDPAHHKVELENDQVRVLRITFGPGEKAPLHHHPDAVAVFLTDARLEIATGGDKPEPTPRKRGEVIWADATDHTVHNTGKHRAEVVLVELKAPAAARSLEKDAVTVDPGRYTVLLENDRVRVVKIRYAAGDKSVMHDHRPGAVVMLADALIRMTAPDGKTDDLPIRAGDILWDTGAMHQPENVGATTMEGIFVEIKSKP